MIDYGEFHPYWPLFEKKIDLKPQRPYNSNVCYEAVQTACRHRLILRCRPWDRGLLSFPPRKRQPSQL